MSQLLNIFSQHPWVLVAVVAIVSGYLMSMGGGKAKPMPGRGRRCGRCRTEHPGHASFCRRCGRALA